MGFDDIILPRTVIAEIYKNNLVETIVNKGKKIVKATIDESIESKSSPGTSGKNLKNVLVLVHYPDVAFIPAEHREFLNKILTACKLNIGEVAIVNTAIQQANEEDIGMLNAKSILVFGECISNILNNKEMDFFIPVYREGISIITAPSLEKLLMTTDDGTQLKSKLWVSLKQFFEV